MKTIEFILTGNAVLTLKSKDPVKVLSVRGTSFAAIDGEGSPSTEAAASGDFAAPNITFVSQELSKSDRPELTAAKVVISGGEFEKL